MRGGHVIGETSTVFFRKSIRMVIDGDVVEDQLLKISKDFLAKLFIMRKSFPESSKDSSRVKSYYSMMGIR